MLIKGLLAVITLMGVIFFLIKRQKNNQAYPVDPDAGLIENQDEKENELDDDQAGEVVATWNLLNPPS
ncbi:MAG: hypothetical protein EHM70_15715 [Chloroflexota bacterium]|nr:MAG: hypothetical protein EHM70_15715 [Chloroflexota bacterium]